MAYSLKAAFLLGGSLWILLFYLYPYVLRLLTSFGMCRANFAGQHIPISVGIVIPVAILFSMPWALLEPNFPFYVWQSIFIIVISYMGWRDDRWGGNDAKGLKGHLVLWLESGRISTGLWKAIIGSSLAIIISLKWSTTIIEFGLHFFLLVLLTNLINLLDLRPGRAIKGFFLLWIPLIILGMTKAPLVIWLPTVFSAAFLFPNDIRGKVMLGDSGSNALGFALGFWMVVYAPISLKIIMFIMAVLIQFYAERRSLTLLIQNIPLLHWVDMLGRQKEKKPG